MLSTLAEQFPPDDRKWAFEFKWDGSPHSSDLCQDGGEWDPQVQPSPWAGLRTRLRQKNAEINRPCRELATLASRVGLLSEENEQLRRAAGTGRVVGLPSGGRYGS